VDESQAGLREQSASQLSVIIPCPPRGLVISHRIRLSPSSFVSRARTFMSAPSELPAISGGWQERRSPEARVFPEARTGRKSAIGEKQCLTSCPYSRD
jgi:hypothetical protein